MPKFNWGLCNPVQAPASQKVVNRKLGRTTVFTIYDRFTKLTDFRYDIFWSQITNWVGAVVNRKSWKTNVECFVKREPGVLYKITVLLKQKKWSVLDITQIDLHPSTHAEKETRIIYNTGNFFCFNINVFNLYNNDVIIYKIKIKSRENSFICERVYLIFLLQHWSNSYARS
jgi:hypothetical protein